MDRSEDFYSTAMPVMLVALWLLPFLALFVWLLVAFWGIEYAAIPWNAHSVPPAQLY